MNRNFNLIGVSLTMPTGQTSEGLVRLALETHEEFPNVAKWLLKDKLICAAEYPHFVLHLILVPQTFSGEPENAPFDHLKHHPYQVLDLLSAFIDRPGHDAQDIKAVLETARGEDKEITSYWAYKALMEVLQNG